MPVTFDDLIPAAPASPSFDDLIPSAPTNDTPPSDRDATGARVLPSVGFDDLIPAQPAAKPSLFDSIASALGNVRSPNQADAMDAKTAEAANVPQRLADDYRERLAQSLKASTEAAASAEAIPVPTNLAERPSSFLEALGNVRSPSAADIQDTQRATAEPHVGAIAHTPLLQIPRLPPTEGDSRVDAAMKAAANAAGGFASSFTSPEMLAALPAGVIAEGDRAVAGYFAGQMASSIPDAWHAVQEAEKTPAGSQERWEAGLNMVTLGLFTHGALNHFVGGGAVPASRTAGESRPRSSETESPAGTTPPEPPLEPDLSNRQHPDNPPDEPVPASDQPSDSQYQQQAPQSPSPQFPRGQEPAQESEFRQESSPQPEPNEVARLRQAEYEQWAQENKSEALAYAKRQDEAGQGRDAAEIRARIRRDFEAANPPPEPDQSPPVEPQPSQQSVTGISKAAISEQRSARDLPEIERAKQSDFGELNDAANAVVADDPLAPSKLVNELAENPRPLRAEEAPLLVRRMQEAQREFDMAAEAANASPDDAAAQTRVDAARAEYDKVVATVQDATTHAGASLNSVKLLLAEDYSLARLESRYRAVANKGRPLNEKQLAEVRDLHAEHEHTARGIEAYEAIKSSRDFSLPNIQEKWRTIVNKGEPLTRQQLQYADKLYQGFKKESKRQSRRGGGSSGIDRTRFATKFDFLDQSRAEAIKRLQRSRELRTNQPVSPEMLRMEAERNARLQRTREAEAARAKAEQERAAATKLTRKAPAELTPEQIAEREYRAELEREANAAQAGHGDEFLDAVEKSGGMPHPSTAQSHKGELHALMQELGRPDRKERINRNKLFKKDAPDLDELATRLRDRGFDVAGPDDVIALAQDRIRSERPHYGTPEREAAGETPFKRQELEGDGIRLRRTTNNIDPNSGHPYSLADETRAAFQPSRNTSAARDLAALETRIARDPSHAEAGVGRPRLTRVELPAGSAHLPDAASTSAAETLARRRGLEVVYFKSDKPLQINAAWSGKKLLINVDSTIDPIHALAGHEIWHDIQRSEPKLAREIQAALQTDPEALRRYEQNARRKGYEDGEIADEFMADLAGEALTDPTRLQQALGGSLARRVLTKLRAWVETALRHLRGQSEAPERYPTASAAVKNLQEARERIVRALRGESGSAGADNFKFKRSEHPDAIKSAAVRTEDGTVHTGAMHPYITSELRANDPSFTPSKGTYGFVTNSGEFLNREQAHNRAVELGQVDSQKLRSLGSSGLLETNDFNESRVDQQQQFARKQKPAVDDETLIGAAHYARSRDFAEWSQAVQADHVTPTPELYQRAKAYHDQIAPAFRTPEEKAAERRKQGLRMRERDLRERGEDADYAPRQRPEPPVMDAEETKLRADLQRTKDAINEMYYRAQRAQRSLPRKVADTFVEAQRAMKLTGITTLGKLAGAGITRLATTPLEEAVGGLLSKSPILRRVAAAAPREGGFSARAELLAPTKGFAQGVRDIPRILKGDRTDAEVLAGEPQRSRSLLEIPGRIHGAIKAPFKEAERVRGTVKRTRFAERTGADLESPRTQQAIREGAHADARRAIFMQDNVLSDFWSHGIRMMENSKKFPTSGYVLGKVARFLLPIVKVPTNVALESATHLTGTVTASGKLIAVMSRGLKNIKPEEADMILRHYKKGLVGAGLFLTGYFNAQNFGGYYQKGEKRDPKDLQAGDMKILGHMIPHWLQHAPAFIVLQAGATAFRVMHGNKPKSAGTATLAIARDIIQQVPFAQELGIIDKGLADGYEGTSVRGRLLQGATVPQGVKNVAEWMDRNAQGETIKRKPKTELDYVKQAIPGLRKDVPTVDEALARQKADRKHAAMLRHLQPH